MKVNKTVGIILFFIFMTGTVACNNKQGSQNKTLNQIRTETNKAFKEVDKAARKTIKKIKGSDKK